MAAAENERKSEPVKIRLNHQLWTRVQETMDSTIAGNLDRQQFLALLIDLGLQQWNEREKGWVRLDDDKSTEKHDGTQG